MYKPNSEQQLRIDAVAQWANESIPEIWGFEQRLTEDPILRFAPKVAENEENHDLYKRTLDQLAQTFNGDDFIKHLSDFYLFPAENPPVIPNQEHPFIHSIQKCLHACLTYYFQQLDIFSNYTTQGSMKRIQYILQHLEDDTEASTHTFLADNGYYAPSFKTLTELALKHVDFLTLKDEWHALCEGDWNVDRLEDGEVWSSSYESKQYELEGLVWKGIIDHLRVNEFSYEHFKTLMTTMPWLFPAGHLGSSVYEGEDKPEKNLLKCLQYGNAPEDISSTDMGLYTTIKSYTEKLAVEILKDTSPANAKVQEKILETMESVVLANNKSIIRACKHIEIKKLKSKDIHDEYGNNRGIRNLMRRSAFKEESAELALAEILKQFQEDTLWMTFPHCGGARKAVLLALDAKPLVALHETLSLMVNVKPYGYDFEADAFYNSEEVEEQIIDQQALSRALDDIPLKQLKRYLKELKACKLGYGDIVKFVEAFAGLNRAALEKSLERHAQASLKAYGLLPVESDDDAKQRYISLKKAWKECSKYGAERQANTRAAVEVGLHHLAIRAGYSDPVRMEWDLEASISEDAQALFAARTIEQWDVCIGMDGVKPVLRISKQGKPLKSVPAGLRATDEYKQYKEVMGTLKEQASRFRRSLESMMTNAESLSSKDLTKLTKIPAMKYLLANLLGINQNNEIGLIDHTSMSLVDGENNYPIDDSIRIAHVHDLFTHSLLAHWQKQIVQQQTVQPFKQVFRELYILTPAEMASATFTNRFAGRTVDTAIAYRLLQARGWGMYERSVTKQQSGGTLEAYWVYPEIHHYFSETSELVSDAIHFAPVNKGWENNATIPLIDVPAIFFSECLRDADLVISVALPRDKSKQNEFWSYEVQEHRTSVAKHIAENLGIKDLRFDDKSVYVQGTWNEYRIHLGSANAYLGSNHLCIGPDNDKGKSKKVYLPFADSDRVLSEIVAKILLLKHDKRIKDKTILEQIRPQAADV